MMFIESKSSPDDLIAGIKMSSAKKAFYNYGNKIVYSIKRDKIVLQKQSPFIQHPFKRVLNIELVRLKDTTRICYYFSYPHRIGLIFVIVLLACIHISALLKIGNFNDMVIITLFFSAYYLLIILLLFTGKLLYKKQEKELVQFLNTIADNPYL